MHWFDTQLQDLKKLAEAYEAGKINSAGEYDEAARFRRTAFIDAIQVLVESVVRSSGIAGCVACHDGLILAQAGTVVDTDALGAVIQESIRIAERSEEILALGEIQQIVIVGAQNKIAMITMGTITLSVLSPVDINLAATLAQGPG